MEREQMFLEMLYEKNTVINRLIEEIKTLKEAQKEKEIIEESEE